MTVRVITKSLLEPSRNWCKRMRGDAGARAAAAQGAAADLRNWSRGALGGGADR
jgi:hypothetical protein